MKNPFKFKKVRPSPKEAWRLIDKTITKTKVDIVSDLTEFKILLYITLMTNFEDMKHLVSDEILNVAGVENSEGIEKLKAYASRLTFNCTNELMILVSKFNHLDIPEALAVVILNTQGALPASDEELGVPEALSSAYKRMLDVKLALPSLHSYPYKDTKVVVIDSIEELYPNLVVELAMYEARPKFLIRKNTEITWEETDTGFNEEESLRGKEF